MDGRGLAERAPRRVEAARAQVARRLVFLLTALAFLPTALALTRA